MSQTIDDTLRSALNAGESRPSASSWSPDQLDTARKIYQIGRERNEPDDHIRAALSTGIVESGFKNLTGDKNLGSGNEAYGVFQQRPVSGWGSKQQVQNVDYAARKFYDAAGKVQKYRSPGHLAAQVQRPRADLRGRYDQELPKADQLFEQFQGDDTPGPTIDDVLRKGVENGNSINSTDLLPGDTVLRNTGPRDPRDSGSGLARQPQPEAPVNEFSNTPISALGVGPGSTTVDGFNTVRPRTVTPEFNERDFRKYLVDQQIPRTQENLKKLRPAFQAMQMGDPEATDKFLAIPPQRTPTLSRALIPAGQPVTNGDLLWHARMDATTFAQLPKLKQQAVLRGVAAEAKADEVRKSRGEAIPQPSLEQQNAFRAKYGLEPVTPNQQGFRESLQFPGQFDANTDQVVGRVKDQSRKLANQAAANLVKRTPNGQQAPTQQPTGIIDEAKRMIGQGIADYYGGQGGAEDLTNFAEGVGSAMAGTGKQVANAADLAMRYGPGNFARALPFVRQQQDEAVQQGREWANRLQQGVQASEATHPSEGMLGDLRQGLERGLGSTAVELPKLLGGGQLLGALNLPVQGALSREEEGVPGLVKGFAGGLVYHYGMGVTGQAVGKLGNALFWTAAPAAGAIASGEKAGRAIGEALPMGALAGMGEGKPVEVKDGESVRPATVDDLPKIASKDLEVVPPERTGLVTPFGRKPPQDSPLRQQVNAIADSLAGPQAQRPIEVRKGTPNETFTGAQPTPERNSFADREVSRETPQVAPEASAGEWQTGRPKTFTYLRNTEKSPNAGTQFQQDIEPAGRYMTEAEPDSKPVDNRWEKGTVTFKNPLVLEWGKGYDETGWKARLSKRYGGKTGDALSKAIAADGYDGIVTQDKYGSSEIVDLTHLTPQVGEVSNKEMSPMGDGKEPWQMTQGEYTFKAGAPKPEMDLFGDVSRHQLSTMSDRAIRDRANTKANDKATARSKYREASDEWERKVVDAYQSNKFSLNDVYDPDTNDNAFYVVRQHIEDSGIPIQSPFKISKMSAEARAQYLDGIDTQARGTTSPPSERQESVTPVSTNGLQSEPVHHSELQPRDAGQFTGGPPAEGITRLYRADRADATEAQGARWSPDLNYVSEKYGKGAQNGESIWYTDVPTKLFEDEYSHVPSVTNTKVIETLGGKVEPKLFRRVNQESAEGGQPQTIDDILTKEQSNATSTREDKGNPTKELPGTGSGEDLSAHNTEVRQGQGRQAEGSDSAERVRAEQEPVQESKAATIDDVLTGRSGKDRSLPKTLDAGQMEKGENTKYEPVSLSESEAAGRQMLKDKGVDGVIEHVLHGPPSHEIAPAAFAALNEMVRQEKAAREGSDLEAEAAINAKRRQFAGDLAERFTELGQTINAVKTIENFAPDKALYLANKLSIKVRKRGLSAEEDARIGKEGEENATHIEALKTIDAGLKERARILDDRENAVSERESKLTDAEKAQGKTEPKAKPEKPKTDYKSRLKEQSDQAKATLKVNLGKLNFGKMTVPVGEKGAVRVGIPALEGDAELLAQYAAGRLGELDNVEQLNKELIGEFGPEVEPHLPEIRQRAFQIQKDARIAELEAAGTKPNRRKTILSEIQNEIGKARREAKEAEDQKIREAYTTARTAESKAERAAKAADDTELRQIYQRGRKADQNVENVTKFLAKAEDRKQYEEDRRWLKEYEQGDRAQKDAKEAKRKQVEASIRNAERFAAKAEAQKARDQEQKVKQATAKEARQRLAQARQEYQEADKAEKKGYRASIKQQREFERNAKLWDTPIRNAAKDARARLANATDSKAPETISDLTAVMAEKMLPEEIRGSPRKGGKSPAALYTELKQEFPNLATDKNKSQVFKQAYEQVDTMAKAAREASRLRGASAESKKLWEQAGMDIDTQALLIQRAARTQKLMESNKRLAREFERVSQSRFKKVANEVLAAPRALQTALNFHIGRQGLFYLVTHPLAVSKGAVGATLKGYAALKPEQYVRAVEELQNHPDYDLGKKAGLNVAELPSDVGGNLSQAVEEDLLQSTWASKLPHVRLSQQGFALGMNTERVNAFSLYAKAGKMAGYTFENNPDFFKQAASVVNDATGRGGMPKAIESMAGITNKLFYATRLNVSRVKLLNDLFNPIKYQQYDPVMRKIMVKETARLVAGVAAMYGAAHMLGLKTSADPDDPDFGKVVWGTHHYDISGGEAQNLRFAFRFMRGIKNLVEGEKQPENQDPLTLAGHFARGKLAPLPGAAMDYLYGKDVIGHPANLKIQSPGKMINENIMARMLVPLVIKDYAEAYQEDGWGGVAKTTPVTAGFGVQDYEPTARGGALMDGLRKAGGPKIVDELHRLGIERLDTTRRAKMEENDKKQTPLTDAQQKALANATNQYLNPTLDKLMSGPAYSKMTDEQKKDAIQEVIRDIKSNALEGFKGMTFKEKRALSQGAQQ